MTKQSYKGLFRSLAILMAVFMLALTTACGGDGNGNGGSSSSISGGTDGDGSGSGSNGGDGSGNGGTGGDGSGNGGTGGDGNGNGGTGGDGSGNGGTGGDGSGNGGTGGDGSGNGGNGGTGGDGSGNGGNGNGTTGEIGNQQELVDKLTQTPDGNFELTADIVITGNWKPIVDSNGGGFTGTLNGNDHTIKFENVTVTPEVINGVEHVGLVGINKGTIQNVIVEGTLEYNASGSGDVYVGAIAGTNENGGTIKNSKSKADIKLVIARPYNIIGAIGGIVGNHAEGIIEGVANLGNITLEHEGGPASPGCSGGDNNGFAGGVVGRLRNNGVLKNSYNTGNITNEKLTECQQRGFRAIGGIVGGTETLESGAKIENGFAFGQLRGTNATRSNVGTIVGRGQVDITNAAGLTEIVAGGVKGTPFGASFGSFTITNVHHSATGVSVTDQNDQSVTLSATQQQSWWQNVLTFNFTNVWKWNASENRPELAWE